MYVWLRLARMMATARSRGTYRIGGESRLAFRCLPTDIDSNMHLNNARYMMLADVGRIDIFARAGLLKLARQNKWAPMMGGLQAVYVREIRLWTKFEVVSTVETWEDTQVIGRHRFVLEDGRTAALVMTTAGVYDFRNRQFLKIDDLFNALGETARPRPPSEEERIFMASHAGLRQLAKGAV
ncbi:MULTISPECIES: thioesterase family protein [unclassified Aminobacter]|uniref:thioesterase family protein n=1 Tax=unclassified Aminobacter TaxID=2644704 RepID=UPI000464668D|nr:MULTISPECIES: thioesterase family protein [unclassified Aminobacter]TWG63496.1 acyl-CoA thioesterase FadM [Aminobacter sp. J44]TWH31585.1 acyl-CoA thioesterase FadM [Aminobacter sp. J15]